MAAIWRFAIPVTDGEMQLELPGPIVHVGARAPLALEIWVRNDGLTEQRTFLIAGTGHEFDAALAHVGTAIVPGGTFVWHLLERVEAQRMTPGVEQMPRINR